MLCGETAAAAKRSGLNAIRAFYGRSQQETAPKDGFFRGLSVRQFCLARCGACRPVAAGSVAGAHCAACGALFCTGALRPLMLMRVMRPCSPLMRIRTRAGCEFCSFMVFLRLWFGAQEGAVFRPPLWRWADLGVVYNSFWMWLLRGFVRFQDIKL